MKKWLQRFWQRPRWQRCLLGALLLGSLAVICFCYWLSPPGLTLFEDNRDYLLSRKGRLTSAETFATELHQGERIEHVNLSSDTGLAVTLSVRYPAMEGPHPAILLIGGHKRGRQAGKLLPPGSGAVVAALDYPLRVDPDIDGFAILTELPQIRGSLYDTAPALQLALDFLLTKPEVDPQQIELVGVSLGAFFACIAGGMDPRFQRVFAVQGGGDVPHLLNHLLAREVGPGWIRAPLAKALAGLFKGLEPERWAGEISPREFVLIRATQDEIIPLKSSQALFEAAIHPKSLIEMEDTHVNGHRQDAIQRLFQIVQTHMADGSPGEVTGQ